MNGDNGEADQQLHKAPAGNSCCAQLLSWQRRLSRQNAAAACLCTAVPRVATVRLIAGESFVSPVRPDNRLDCLWQSLSVEFPFSTSAAVDVAHGMGSLRTPRHDH